MSHPLPAQESAQHHQARGKGSHTRNRHLRKHRGILVAFSNGSSVAFSNGISPVSVLSKGLSRAQWVFTGISPWTFDCVCQYIFMSVISGVLCTARDTVQKGSPPHVRSRPPAASLAGDGAAESRILTLILLLLLLLLLIIIISTIITIMILIKQALPSGSSQRGARVAAEQVHLVDLSEHLADSTCCCLLYR